MRDLTEPPCCRWRIGRSICSVSRVAPLSALPQPTADTLNTQKEKVDQCLNGIETTISSAAADTPIREVTTDGTIATVIAACSGAITTTMLLMGQSTSALHTTAFFAALVMVLVVTFVVLALSPMLLGRIGKSGLTLVTKVMGLIVLVIGVQLMIDGFRPVAVDILKSASRG